MMKTLPQQQPSMRSHFGGVTMTLYGWIIIVILAATTTAVVVEAVSQPLAWQDTYETPSFAASVKFNTIDQTLLVVGSTYENAVQQTGSFACFFNVFHYQNQQPQGWTQQHFVGHTTTTTTTGGGDDSPTVSSQACVDVTIRTADQHAMVVGHSGIGPGGVLDDLYNRMESEINQRYGTLMDWNNVNANGNHQYTLMGGEVQQGFSAVYPMAVTSSPVSEDYVYVASLFTDEMTVQDDFVHNFGDPNTAFPVGQDVFGLLLEGYRRIGTTGTAGGGNSDSDNKDLSRTALRTFRTVYLPSSGQDTVHVAGLVQLTEDLLVVAGHTAGQGKAFGVSVFQDNAALGSVDGFVTKIRADNGHVWTTTTTTTTNSEAATFRVQSLNQGDEFVYGICEHAYGSTRDPDSVYIVGSTTGNLERNVATTSVSTLRSAYILKLDLVSMQPIWTKQLSDTNAYASVDGMACAVTRDGQEVWMAGNIQGGGKIQYTADNEEFGGDTDVFVAKFAAENGQVMFVRQFGSSAADVVASHGGLVTDLEGNAIVVGNTQGSLFSKVVDGGTAAPSNVFLASISRSDGAMAGTIENPNGGDAIVPLPTAPQAAPTVVTNPPPTALRPDIPLTFPPVHPLEKLKNPNAHESGGGGKWVGLLMILLALMGIVVLVAVFVNRSLHRDHSHTDRGKVLEYLGSFDVEDVDLKHSATGGWHCSYTNDLAEGKVRKSTSNHANLLLEGSPRKSTTISGIDPLMAESLTNSTIVKDSLFMIDDDDEDDPLKTGAESAFLHHRHSNNNSNSSKLDIADSSGYDGLVDAYNNSSWDDRNQQLLQDNSSGRGSKKGSRRKSRGLNSNSSSKRRSSDEDESWGRPIV